MQVLIVFSCLLLVAQYSKQEKISAGRQMFNGGATYYAPPNNGYKGYYGQNVKSSSSSSSVLSSSVSALSSSSSTGSISVLQERWTKADMYCNTVVGRVTNVISRIEETTLGLPMQMIKAALGIPSQVVHLSTNLAESLLPNLERAKLMLQGFFQTMFDIPAKALYGTISIFMDLINKILKWGQTCHGQDVCRQPIPHVGGYGPCGGLWPCTKVTACQTNSCLSSARALDQDASLIQDVEV